MDEVSDLGGLSKKLYERGVEELRIFWNFGVFFVFDNSGAWRIGSDSI